MKFVDLPLLDETSSSTALEQNYSSQKRSDLKLDLPTDSNPNREDFEFGSSRLIFSPGGSQAYVFTGTENQPETSESSPKITPREIKDPIFLERRSKKDLQIQQSSGRSGLTSVQKKLEDLRLAHMDPFEDDDLRLRSVSVTTTAESSPRLLPHLPKIQQKQVDAYHEQEIGTDIDSLPSPGKTV